MIFFCHRVTPVYRYFSGKPGPLVFLTGGAPAASPHSHANPRAVLLYRCTAVTQHTLVPRAAANTCLYIMPCAAGELCQLLDDTTPELSCCGPFQGPLHRICGEIHNPDDDQDENRICQSCVAAKTADATSDRSNAAKRKEGGSFLQQGAPKKRKNDEPVLDDTEEVESAEGRGFALPPPFSELSSLFGPLEEHAESCGISEAVYHLRKAKMSFIAARASKPAVQTDIEPCFLADNWYRYSLCPRATVIVTYKKYGVWCWICSTMAGRCMPVPSSHSPL